MRSLLAKMFEFFFSAFKAKTPKQIAEQDVKLAIQAPSKYVDTLPPVEDHVPPTEAEIDEIILQVILKKDMDSEIAQLIVEGAKWDVVSKSLFKALRNRGISPNRASLKVQKIKERLKIS